MYKKGYNFERDIKLKLENEGWIVIRSGGSKKPDMVAAKDGKIMIIECKVTKNSKIYLEKEEVLNIKKVAKEFKADCMFAVKKIGCGKKWNLLSIESLKELNKSYVGSLD
jgi:Holliday junction resolvase